VSISVENEWKGGKRKLMTLPFTLQKKRAAPDLPFRLKRRENPRGTGSLSVLLGGEGGVKGVVPPVPGEKEKSDNSSIQEKSCGSTISQGSRKGKKGEGRNILRCSQGEEGKRFVTYGSRGERGKPSTPVRSFSSR